MLDFTGAVFSGRDRRDGRDLDSSQAQNDVWGVLNGGNMLKITKNVVNGCGCGVCGDFGLSDVVKMSCKWEKCYVNKKVCRDNSNLCSVFF